MFGEQQRFDRKNNDMSNTPDTGDIHEEVNVSRIKAGDTVLIDGQLKTVCQKDLGYDELLGPTLWGDSYKAGHEKVTRVTFAAEIQRREAAQQRALDELAQDTEDDTIDECPSF